MKLKFVAAAFLSLTLSSPLLGEGAKASELDWLCGDFSFLGDSKVYVGRASNGRQLGLVVFDARSDTGRVLVLYAYGPKRGGSGGQGCGPAFGKIDGNTLVSKGGQGSKAIYKFEGVGQGVSRMAEETQGRETRKADGPASRKAGSGCSLDSEHRRKAAFPHRPGAGTGREPLGPGIKCPFAPPSVLDGEGDGRQNKGKVGRRPKYGVTYRGREHENDGGMVR